MPALSYSLVTLAELKAWIPVTGTAADAVLDFCRGTATKSIESFLDRRIIFRAPAEVVGAANILPSTSFVNGAVVGFSQPAAGRTLIVTFSSGLTAGVLTVTGTVAGVAGVARTFNVVDGLVQYGVDFFTAISAMSAAGVTGTGTVLVGSSLGYVEYHFKGAAYGAYGYDAYRWADGRGWNSDLYARERPILNILEVNEDPSRVYAVGTKLVEGTDYIVNRSDGRLLRWSGNGPTSWPYGQRIIRNTYSAGYFTAANVPLDIKEVCLSLADRIYKERGREGEQSHSDAMGTVTRFSPAFLTSPMREQIMPYRRGVYDPSMTAEWDFDSEAA